MISWIRKGEIEANKISTEPFSSSNIKKLIPTMKKLSSNNVPESIEILKEICRKNGIALIILPHLPKTFVNGVSKWLGKDKALIILSNKGKKTDAFWFNFFHELGHLLSHSKKELFINSDESKLFKIEEEANLFAKYSLIPKKDYEDLIEHNFTRDVIVDFSDKLEIHPSIILGILQYDKYISYQTNLNSLKEDLHL